MPIIEEETEVSTRIDNIYEHKVILHNDDVNSFEHVEDCLMRICFKTKKDAEKIALEAHNKGKAVCYEGSIEACETVAEKMGDERLTVSLA
ncbi:MAG TPA: ATP-dependent Clp protease adaptor ClpS [Leptospiraceae bacterium]|nr:ATP-dependent Clp protease adaptor ClpS [Leptospiraceae bacterium]HMW08213.1 ATP-dependent Clp protease adaptor ClpS [Leptospiraceae bacterium]HMX34406.1 ATP-dependent Clp protease adaptor ClpS [Leptospiraceae bacterium]HMZ64625.1 ATP-dependent Clp protease adaptor ClpS [Leptospiraceae bacterium]HNA09103.1 ATP-dependent Clp protease adaptor ClpS [Leptospiraceae bacterium]